MQDPACRKGALSRRRFLSLSGQSALAVGLAQLIPIRLLADETLPDLPPGLLRMARDIFPHDFLDDAHYIRPLADLVKAQPKQVTQGLADLQQQARKRHGEPFETLNEKARVGLLTEIEETPFFKAVRSNLMFGIYNNKALFPLFGYEGSSWQYGGYVNRGFNDLDWL